MTWNDELSGHLEVINARLTNLERLPMLAFEHEVLAFAEYQPPAVQSLGSVALKDTVLHQALHT